MNRKKSHPTASTEEDHSPRRTKLLRGERLQQGAKAEVRRQHGARARNQTTERDRRAGTRKGARDRRNQVTRGDRGVSMMTVLTTKMR